MRKLGLGADAVIFENVRATLNSIGPWLGGHMAQWHSGTSGLLIEATVPKPVKTGDMESLVAEEEIMGLIFEPSNSH